MPKIGWSPSQETRMKMRLAQLGRKHPPEVKLKISLANKGKIFTPEHCHNLSLALKGKAPSMLGKHHTEETKQKLRLQHLGMKASEETKRKMSLKKMKEGSPNWNGGRRLLTNGYIQILSQDHPYKSKDGYVLQHRLVMEKHLERYLDPKEVVHHINENPSDNRLENLMLFPDMTEHLNYHRKLRNTLDKRD